MKHGQELEPNGQVTRIEDEKVTIALGPLVTVDIGVVRLVEKYRPPSRMPDRKTAPGSGP